NDYWRVALLPADGGSVASGAIKHDGEWVDVLRPTPLDGPIIVPDTASYPLVPWSNRIRGGLISWEGEDYYLRKWLGNDVAMHGTGDEFPWEVLESSSTHAVLEFDSRGYYGVNFPWDFVARFTYTLDGERFTWGMSVHNVDD